MNLLQSLAFIAKGGQTSFTRSVLWELLHALLIGAPSGILMIILWELFQPVPNEQRVMNLIYVMAGLLVLQFFVAAKASMETNIVAFDIGAIGRMKLGNHLRKLSMGFFKQKDPGDVTAVLLNDMDNVEWVLSHSMANIYNAVFGVSIFSLFLLYLDWRLTLALWAGILISIPFIWFSTRLVERLGKVHKRSVTDVNSRFLEYLLGLRYVKAYELGGKKFKTLQEALSRLRKDSIRVEAIPGPFAMTPLALLELAFIGMIALGLYFLLGGSLTVPVFLVFLILGYRFYEPVRVLMLDLVIMRYMKIGVDRVVDVLQTEPLPEPEQDEPLTAFDIEFRDVSFGYQEQKVLQEVSFRIPERSMTALVGPSGCGKTTITSLIARFWEVDAGQILIGGKPVQHIPQERLFQAISMVFQDVYLFQDTIYNNIKVGRMEATDEEIAEAARKAQCLDFIEKFPAGMDTLVGEGGSKLSGGQKQRISIARALLKDAPIILLDEATASLDPENEVYIQQAIQELIVDKTVVVIAHKLQTIRAADQMIVLKEGQVVETGKHDELLSQGGLYARLWQEQQQATGWTFKAENEKKGALSYDVNQT
jgi:ATP-binding cassette subfamily B protein IrtB